ncbi:hypothetical protein J2Z69_001785 [Paenibacillus shirakamiensis]|uniref:Uncharacterized protein n=1 Tax=Paenibacillus shirakamiensis TaxID=1265935 RepID=A0ABS4JGB3_9BACL|nr:hypothetical protein [Paenibacillus shirakamiensis]MBP2000754.1 hypothetical protein [Paenibacillus shirakamiensis]
MTQIELLDNAIGISFKIWCYTLTESSSRMVDKAQGRMRKYIVMEQADK